MPNAAFLTVAFGRPHRREDTWQRGEASDQASCEVLVFAPDFGALHSAGSRPAVRGSSPLLPPQAAPLPKTTRKL